jgi:8-oxo-dGTP pyrophosphatase MutT (NUDIX family)
VSPQTAHASGWMEELQGRLSRRVLRPPASSAGSLRRAGVLVPLFVRDGQLWIVFTRRTDTLEHHRGQISFPGGAEEPGDESLLATALRETEEELGIAPEDVRPLGALSPLATATNFYVEPHVATIPQPYVFRPAAEEIAEVLEVPVPALLDPAVREEKRMEGRPEPILFYRYGDHVIWGATARMLEELLEVLTGRS